ncbi:MAG TPA: cytochrome P450 [Sporichthyaceae bacterium]|nr:cytochrome P450 [Sporichthyaceae bacterium]
MTEATWTAESPDVQTDFDIHDPAGVETIFDQYAELRSRCPIAHSTKYGGHWVMTRYDDIDEAMRNPAVFSSECVNIPPTIGQDGPMIPLEIDPPDHTTYRRIMTPLFSPTRMRRLEPQVRALVLELIDNIGDATEIDYVEMFAKELPTRVFLKLMGWSMHDAARLNDWTDRIVLGLPGASEEESTAFRMEAALEVYAHFAEMIDERFEERENGAARPTDPDVDDITDVLVNSKFGDRELTQFEMLNILFLMMIGGLHTVQGQLAHSTIHLAQDPAKRKELIEHPELIPAAVEEFLRYESAVAGARVVQSDIVVNGVQLRAGDRVLIPLAAANRDPAKFDRPDEIDFTRESNPHVAFGGGRHRCLGSHLARIELTIAFEEWHKRFPNYRLHPDQPYKKHLSQVRGVESLPLLLNQSL